MKAVTGSVAGFAVGVAALIAVTACSSSPSASILRPVGGGSSATAANGQSPAGGVAGVAYVMPPFGKNVHIEMTSWLPSGTAQAAAVITDKDYELAYLYSEYRGGQDQSWVSYVSSMMQSAVQQSLRATDVITESFTGTISYFDMRVIPDPQTRGDLDVSSCFDNAASSNTNLSTGAVLPNTSPADSHYVRITDELRKDSAGQWQVVSSLPAVSYPKAEECKPS
jgi:hypothetical protein